MGKQKKVTLDTRRAWFGQTAYFLIPTMALVIYSLAAATNVEFLAFMDRGVNPLVDTLQYIGLGVVKPFVTGPMPERYYVNLVGIGMWGILAYNVRTILWMVSYHRHSSLVAVAAKEAAAKNGWTARRTWIVQRLLLLFLIVPATAYAWLCLLNSISGWIVFHVDDLFTPLLVVGTFQAPGMFAVGLLLMIMVYLVQDLVHLRRMFTQER